MGGTAKHYLRLVSIITCIIYIAAEKCPSGCECDTFKFKLKCSGPLWQDFKNSNLLSGLPTLQQLDLSKNKITKLDATFISVPSLKKLNLSDNKIKFIHLDAFSNISGLTTLDLSGNSIVNLSRPLFTPLTSLERLKLRGNQLTTLDSDVFYDLKRIRMVDLSDNPWTCDCALAWISDWIKAVNVKFQHPAKCMSPIFRAGMSLKKLDYPCPNIAGLDVEPAEDQVVFAGDSLTLRCRGDGVTDRVKWVWHDLDPRERFHEVNITERTLPEHGLVESWIRIERLEPHHSGDWICQQVAGGNYSATVSVLVLSESTKYCSNTVTRDNKGEYFWPRSVLGHRVELPCSVERIGSDRGTASYTCNPDGHWENFDSSECAFSSETTRILQQFVLDDLTAPLDPIVDKARILLNITRNSKQLQDPIDIIFISKTIENYCEFLESSIELPGILIDVIITLQNISTVLLETAEKQDKACSRLRSSLEKIIFETPSFHAQNRPFEVFSVQSEAFTGMACIWRRHHFRCTTNGRAMVDAPGRDLLAFVELSTSFFPAFSQISHKLAVSMFQTSYLFPDVLENDQEYQYSSVVGVLIDGLDGMNLTDPVAVMLSISPYGPAEPVRWEPGLHGGVGGWSTGGCISTDSSRDHLLFHCYNSGYYSIRQQLGLFQRQGRSIFSQALVYSGSFVLLVCTFVAMATYVTCHRSVQMPRRAKHAVTNTWLSIFMLCFTFTFGINATDNERFCELLGLSLHYFSLSALLWMVVASNHMFKRMSRGSAEQNSEDLPPGAPIQKPILGLYLVGWGIGLIVCGISGAVHLKDYAQPDFCFLGPGPALSALLVPAGILTFILCLFFVLTVWAIRNNDVNGQLSEGTQGTENVDLELLEEGVERTERRSDKSIITDSEDIEDPEHAPIVQLKAHAIVLSLFLLFWILGAFLTVTDIRPVLPYQEPIIHCLYSLVTFFLGAFILYFYCVARSDVRAQWTIAFNQFGASGRCCRSRSVSDTHASLPLQPTVNTVNNRPPSVNSGVTGRSSSSQRAKTAVHELNNCDTSDSVSVHRCRPSNSVNLVAMHRQLYRSNNSMPTYHEVSSQNAAAFYNPRQSVVAKKFFKKQRRNRRNELGMRRRGDGGGTSDGEISHCRHQWRPSAESAVFLSSDMENNSDKVSQNIFGYGSKINNTNIHVGQFSRRRDTQSPKDPNVLSEEDDEKNSEKQLLARMVIGAEEDSTSVAPDVLSMEDESPGQLPECRSVQLQCSLGDSSDAPDGEDSFLHKIDDMQFVSDESYGERLSSPPQYVTVMDPKYGVVKVTMSDYQERLGTLLPSTPEEVIEEEDPSPKKNNFVNTPNSLSPAVSLGSRASSKGKRTPPKSLNLPARNYSPRRSQSRRSLPSTPEAKTEEIQRRSLPSTPKALPRPEIPLAKPRESPKLTLPPPPDFPATSDEWTGESCDDLNCKESGQWQKPDPPTSPLSHRTDRPPDNLIDRKKFRHSLTLSPEEDVNEPKKETCV